MNQPPHPHHIIIAKVLTWSTLIRTLLGANLFPIHKFSGWAFGERASCANKDSFFTVIFLEPRDSDWKAPKHRAFERQEWEKSIVCHWRLFYYLNKGRGASPHMFSNENNMNFACIVGDTD
jgi:hypothetical protein